MKDINSKFPTVDMIGTSNVVTGWWPAMSVMAFGTIVCVFAAAPSVLVGRRDVAVADRQTTADSRQETPQQALSQMSDGRVARMTADQAISLYQANNDNERRYARLMAGQAIVAAKLEENVGKKWGPHAKAAVAHACQDNTPNDNAKAEWTIADDRAVARFKVDGLAPMLLVRVQGHWKIDVSGYVVGLGAQLDAGMKYVKDSTDILQQANDKLMSSKSFSSVDELTNYVRDSLAKLG
jgi:hypothetical protein